MRPKFQKLPPALRQPARSDFNNGRLLACLWRRRNCFDFSHFADVRIFLKCAFINQPVEVAKLRPELAALVGLPGRRPDIVMRFGYGPLLPYSARRGAERTQ